MNKIKRKQSHMKKKCHAINTNPPHKPDSLNTTANNILKPTLDNAFNKVTRIVHTLKDLCTEPKNKITRTNGTTNIIKNQSNFIFDESRKRKVLILADSHGRGIRELISERLSHTYSITSSIKPNAIFEDVIKDYEDVTQHFGKEDCIIIIGGTNDLDSFDFKIDKLVHKIISTVEKSEHTNIMISSIPYRHDQPYHNRIIHKFNIELKIALSKYSNATFLPLFGFNRTFYTYHGLHFNNKGKIKFSEVLIESTNKVTKLQQTISVIITNRNVDKMKKYSSKSDHHFLENNYSQKQIS